MTVLDALGPSKRFPRDWVVKLLRKHSSPPHPEQQHISDTILQDKALVVAPMVDQSDLPFRLLCRKYGANLCFTPMIHAKMFIEKEGYHRKFWDVNVGTPEEDRPLFAQFCSSCPQSLLKAAAMIQHQVDAIDLNCGCPQTIAKRGKYGAFLLENETQLLHIVKTLSSQLSIPITVKVRILPSGVEDSLNLYRALVQAGASLITVHGRNRHQKGQETGPTDWDAIRQVVQTIGEDIPIFSNGSISSLDDVKRCVIHTNADGVMSSEAILEYPALFLGQPQSQRTISRIQLAREFYEICLQHPPDRAGQGTGLKCARVHLHRILHADLQSHFHIRTKLVEAKSYDELKEVMDNVEQIQWNAQHDIAHERPSWYVRHREKAENSDVPKSRVAWEKTKIVKCVELDDETAAGIVDMFCTEEEGCW